MEMKYNIMVMPFPQNPADVYVAYNAIGTLSSESLFPKACFLEQITYAILIMVSLLSFSTVQWIYLEVQCALLLYWPNKAWLSCVKNGGLVHFIIFCGLCGVHQGSYLQR